MRRQLGQRWDRTSLSIASAFSPVSQTSPSLNTWRRVHGSSRQARRHCTFSRCNTRDSHCLRKRGNGTALNRNTRPPLPPGLRPGPMLCTGLPDRSPFSCWLIRKFTSVIFQSKCASNNVPVKPCSIFGSRMRTRTMIVPDANHTRKQYEHMSPDWQRTHKRARPDESCMRVCFVNGARDAVSFKIQVFKSSSKLGEPRTHKYLWRRDTSNCPLLDTQHIWTMSDMPHQCGQLACPCCWCATIEWRVDTNSHTAAVGHMTATFPNLRQVR